MDDQVITTDGPSMSVSRYGPLESSVCTASFRVGATFGGLNFMVSVTGAGTRTASEVPVALGSVDDNASWLLVEGTETLRLEDEILEVALLGAARCSRDDEAECEEIVDARLRIEGPAYTSVDSLDVEPSTSMVDVGREGLPPCLVLL